MAILITGLVLFLGVHLLGTFPTLRTGLRGRLGKGGYMGAYSLISAVGLGLIILGYGRAPYVALWDRPVWTWAIAFALMLPVFPLLVAAYVPGRIKTYIHHPMVTATVLWALAHLLVRGTLAAAVLFAGFLLWSAFDLVSLHGRDRASMVVVKAGPIRNDIVALVGGLALYLGMITYGHWALIGVPILPPNLPAWILPWPVR